MNLKEFGELKPSFRFVKLETLPKQFSDYFVNYVIRNEIYYYMYLNTFAGHMIRLMNNYDLDIRAFLPDSIELSNEKSFQAEIEAMFAMRYCQDMFHKVSNNDYINDAKLKKQEAELAEYEMIMYSASMSFLNSATQGIDEEAYETYRKVWNDNYKPIFYSILKRNMERDSALFSRTETEFKYKTINEAVKDFFKNVRTYKDKSLIVETRYSQPVYHIFTKNRELEGKTLDVKIYSSSNFNAKISLDNVSGEFIRDQLIHYSEMINVIPELKNYKISSNYSFNYHDYNMMLIELDDIVREGLENLKSIDENIKKLNEEKPLDYLARIDNLQTIYRNIKKSVIAYNDAKDDLPDLPAHLKNVNMLSKLKRESEIISQWIEKLGNAKRNPRNAYDWGVTVLDFTKDYKPSINYKQYSLRLGDGFFWEKIPFGYSEKERDTMGHCGNAGRDEQDVFYSLRRKYKNNTYSVHVTLTVNKVLGVTIECKGRGNMPPIEQYWPYLVELFIRDDLIQCAESGLGHDPNSDFNINMSKDAISNKDKILKIKPYLFSKYDFVYNFLSENKGNDDQSTITRSSLLESVVEQNQSFINWFVFNGRRHIGSDYIADIFEESPEVYKNKVFIKIKNKIEDEIIDTLIEEGTITNNTFMSEEDTYIINGRRIFQRFEGYKGRKFLDQATSYYLSKNKKIPMTQLYDFDKLIYQWNTIENQKLIIEYLNEISGDGFEILRKETDKNDSKVEKIDFGELVNILAHDNKKTLWFAPYVTGDEFYEWNYDISNSDITDVRSNHLDEIIELIDDVEIKDFISNTLLRTDEDGLLYEQNLNVLENAIGGAIRNLYKADVNDQMYSKFSEHVSDCFTYNPKTMKFNIEWKEVIDKLSDKHFDDSEENPLSLDGFYELIKPVLEHKLNDNNVDYKKFIQYYSPILKLMIGIFDECTDIDDLNSIEFEPDIDLYDDTARNEFAERFAELIWLSRDEAYIPDGE
jgi:hypothetical protein